MPYGLYDEESHTRAAMGFQGPNTALRRGRRVYPCPTCKEENQLTEADKRHGYQCDACADRDEAGFCW